MQMTMFLMIACHLITVVRKYRLYLSGSLTDVTIKCVDKELKVHKAVLAWQSPFFPTMLEADMSEARSGVIELLGITSAAMSDLVDYFYAGTAPNLKSLANELLDVSNRYQIDRLFVRRLSEKEDGRGSDTPVQADLYGREKLRKTCFEFISVNTAKISSEEAQRSESVFVSAGPRILCA